MHSALDVLKLDELIVVHAGEEIFPLREKIRAVAFGRFQTDIEPLR